MFEPGDARKTEIIDMTPVKRLTCMYLHNGNGRWTRFYTTCSHHPYKTVGINGVRRTGAAKPHQPWKGLKRRDQRR